MNTLVNSLFVYKLSALPSPPKQFFNQYKNWVINFVWNNKSPKIGYRKLVQSYERIGLMLVDLKTKEIALKAVWPVRWTDRDPSELSWFYTDLPVKDSRIWECNMSPQDIDKLSTKIVNPPTAYCIWKSWALCTYQDTLDSPEDMLNGILWGNSLVRQNNQPIFEEKLINSNIEQILDIWFWET